MVATLRNRVCMLRHYTQCSQRNAHHNGLRPNFWILAKTSPFIPQVLHYQGQKAINLNIKVQNRLIPELGVTRMILNTKITNQILIL